MAGQKQVIKIDDSDSEWEEMPVWLLPQEEILPELLPEQSLPVLLPEQILPVLLQEEIPPSVAARTDLGDPSGWHGPDEVHHAEPQMVQGQACQRSEICRRNGEQAHLRIRGHGYLSNVFPLQRVRAQSW